MYDVDDPQATPAQGYYRVLGVRASVNQIQQILIREIEDGIIQWPDSELQPINPDSLDNEIRKQIRPVVADGIWYRSGRIFYADEDLEPEPS
jgi:hypothetical protein